MVTKDGKGVQNVHAAITHEVNRNEWKFGRFERHVASIGFEARNKYTLLMHQFSGELGKGRTSYFL